MLDSILSNVTTTADTAVSLQNVILCTLCSLVFGMIVALTHMYKNIYTRSFVLNLVVMPVIVQAVIMLVNGNLGTGMAVLGAFSLVRFRSVPGSAREIGSIFLVMAIGLANGMGYVAYAAFITLVICGMTFLLTALNFGEPKNRQKELKITVPENLDYTQIFTDLFTSYTSGHELLKVRTTNMGSLYELCYTITLKHPEQEKELLDEIRCRNGNLNITCGRASSERFEL